MQGPGQGEKGFQRKCLVNGAERSRARERQPPGVDSLDAAEAGRAAGSVPRPGGLTAQLGSPRGPSSRDQDWSISSL